VLPANGDAAATAPRTIKFPFRSRVKLSHSLCTISRKKNRRKSVAAAVFLGCVFTWKQFLWHVKNLF